MVSEHNRSHIDIGCGEIAFCNMRFDSRHLEAQVHVHLLEVENMLKHVLPSIIFSTNKDIAMIIYYQVQHKTSPAMNILTSLIYTFLGPAQNGII